ncbi:hypothetical protein [Rossellomorea aquimaris]|uniref:Uncharacterized protein n=1 Tax=Rossellomorea aquimaris TaxID=189382 RepID=A0A5D4U148_9BACI|nr:hypothetical protein [Rossellomorea aquimaris]TYS80993.1 hypothetical protein FZC80_07780 [Rossellomorea aquimaris]
MEELYYIPIPLFILDAHLNIEEASLKGAKLMQGPSFLDMIEEESATKFSKYFHRHSSGSIEINFTSKEMPNMPVLHDVHFQFVEIKQKYFVAVISKAADYSEVSKKLDRIQKQLWNPNQEDAFQKQLHPSSFHLDSAAGQIRKQESDIQSALEQLKQLKEQLKDLEPEKQDMVKQCMKIEETLKNNIKSQ